MFADKVCDVCGSPATSWAMDVIRHEVPTEMWVAYSPTKFYSYGCDQHPATSSEHVTCLPPSPEPEKKF